jgi:hypothetical protein
MDERGGMRWEAMDAMFLLSFLFLFYFLFFLKSNVNSMERARKRSGKSGSRCVVHLSLFLSRPRLAALSKCNTQGANLPYACTFRSVLVLCVSSYTWLLTGRRAHRSIAQSNLTMPPAGVTLLLLPSSSSSFLTRSPPPSPRSAPPPPGQPYPQHLAHHHYRPPPPVLPQQARDWASAAEAARGSGRWGRSQQPPAPPTAVSPPCGDRR